MTLRGKDTQAVSSTSGDFTSIVGSTRSTETDQQKRRRILTKGIQKRQRVSESKLVQVFHKWRQRERNGKIYCALCLHVLMLEL